jgi:hypothetical protein
MVEAAGGADQLQRALRRRLIALMLLGLGNSKL